ncbi:MAG: hypothetical protein RR851_15085 [Clostridium sp.]
MRNNKIKELIQGIKESKFMETVRGMEKWKIGVIATFTVLVFVGVGILVGFAFNDKGEVVKLPNDTVTTAGDKESGIENIMPEQVVTTPPEKTEEELKEEATKLEEEKAESDGQASEETPSTPGDTGSNDNNSGSSGGGSTGGNTGGGSNGGNTGGGSVTPPPVVTPPTPEPEVPTPPPVTYPTGYDAGKSSAALGLITGHRPNASGFPYRSEVLAIANQYINGSLDSGTAKSKMSAVTYEGMGIRPSNVTAGTVTGIPASAFNSSEGLGSYIVSAGYQGILICNNAAVSVFGEGNGYYTVKFAGLRGSSFAED